MKYSPAVESEEPDFPLDAKIANQVNVHKVNIKTKKKKQDDQNVQMSYTLNTKKLSGDFGGSNSRK